MLEAIGEPGLIDSGPCVYDENKIIYTNCIYSMIKSKIIRRDTFGKTTYIYMYRRLRFLGVHSYRRIRSGGEYPRLNGMEGHVQDSKVVESFVIAQTLQRHNQWILEKITKTLNIQIILRCLDPMIRRVKTTRNELLLVNHSMRYDETTVVSPGSEQRITLMERNTSYSCTVQSQSLIGFRAQIEIEPQHFSVVSPNEDVVTGRMYRHRRYPLRI